MPPRRALTSLATSDLPATLIGRNVRARGPGSQRQAQVAGQQRVDALNARKRVPYAGAHRFPRPLRLIAESPLATAESSSRAELVDERVSL
jgi:hypothetical protein